MIEVSLPGAQIGFTTRKGGVSDGPFESLNLGALTDDLDERVRENRLRVAQTCGISPDRIAFSKQVHGTEIQEWHKPPEDGRFSTTSPVAEHADGHTSSLRGLGLMVFTADCVPVVLASPSRVSILHCGWRPLAAGIIEQAISRYGASSAAIGPGIGGCCYEVGQDVLACFSDLDGVCDDRRLDLRAVIRKKLDGLGVSRVEDVDLCTSCRGDLFFSHRRDGGVTGRQGAIVWRQ
jgi:YfiH family protein